MSIYDKITTAEALVREVIANGLSSEVEDRNRAADIVGSTPIGELAALANHNGLVCGKKLGETLYFILFKVWGWYEAASFYNEHTFDANGKLRDLRTERDVLAINNESACAEIVRLTNQRDRAHSQFREYETRAIQAEQEVITLKAKLYDFMCTKEEKAK